MESPFRIGEWLVEPQRDQLIGPDQRVKIEPRAMQVLVYLAEHPGEVVPRSDPGGGLGGSLCLRRSAYELDKKSSGSGWETTPRIHISFRPFLGKGTA